MARCLRCKAGNEWIEGNAPKNTDRLDHLESENARLQAALKVAEQNDRRYLWWRENIDAVVNDSDGIAGVAYCYQIPLHGIDSGVPEQTSGDLMDAIADRALASVPGKTNG